MNKLLKIETLIDGQIVTVDLLNSQLPEIISDIRKDLNMEVDVDIEIDVNDNGMGTLTISSNDPHDIYYIGVSMEMLIYRAIEIAIEK